MIVKTHSVFCDLRSKRCHSWIAQVVDAEGGTKQARKEAKRAGWKRENGLDICPGCQVAELE